MSKCGACYGKGYFLLTKEEEWEWVRCDCFLDKGEGGQVKDKECKECGFYEWDADSVPLADCLSCGREKVNV